MKSIFLTALIAFAFPMAALADETPSTQAGAPATVQPPANGNAAPASGGAATKICKLERKTGSNMSVRVCRTPEQMAADREAARDALVRGKGSNRSEPVNNGTF